MKDILSIDDARHYANDLTYIGLLHMSVRALYAPHQQYLWDALSAIHTGHIYYGKYMYRSNHSARGTYELQYPNMEMERIISLHSKWNTEAKDLLHALEVSSDPIVHDRRFWPSSMGGDGKNTSTHPLIKQLYKIEFKGKMLTS